MRRRIPSLQTLLCFDAAARQLSYTRAAQELALTQGAVSRQIAALEAALGVALFARTRHGVTLTPRGQAYAAQVAARLAALEQDTLDVMSTQGGARVLHLAAVPTFAARWLVPRLGALKQAQPKLTLHIDTRTRPFLFADTPFDAALHAGTPEQLRQWAGTVATPLLDEWVLPVCAPTLLGGQGPRPAPALAAMPLLQQSTRPEAWRQWFSTQGVTADGARTGPRLEQFSMTTAAAVQGLGVALLPRLLIEPELARGELVPACSAPQSGALPSQRTYYLVRPERQPGNPALDDLLVWLLKQARADAPGAVD